ncbi:MAG: DUF975 family protein [bacterium]|nr:DUF975 family protein [bacterium]
MKTRAGLKEAAKKQLKDKWVDSIIVVVVFMAIVGLISSIFGNDSNTSWIGSLIVFVVSGPLSYVLTKYFLDLARGTAKKVNWNKLAGEFKSMFTPALVLYFWVALKTFLWSLLLVVPGIIKAYGYSQSFYILVDNKKMDAKEIMAKSEKMMNGHKWELFVLQLSFFGWALLCVLTFGIGYLWLIPYMNTTFANYYDGLKK